MAQKTDVTNSADNGPSSRHELNIGPIVIAFLLLVFLLWAYTRAAIPATMAFCVAVGAAVGYIAGRCPFHLTDAWAARQCNLTDEDLQGFQWRCSRQEGSFLTFSSILVAGYVIFYWYAASRIADSTGGETVSFMVVAIAIITIGAFCYASARYAAYIRMTNLLNCAVLQPQVPEAVLGRLRAAVFRGEQIYEPAGNIFVTLGITATFLGLAVGLVTLNLAQFFPEPGASEGVINRSATTIASLGSFVGCMGLALAMSMLGVLTSMAAQWLRGYGPTEATDDLIRRSKPFPTGPGGAVGL